MVVLSIVGLIVVTIVVIKSLKPSKRSRSYEATYLLRKRFQ